MNTTHSQRLQSDLDLVRLLGVLVDEDSSADVAAVIEVASSNLQKCRNLERYFLRFDDIVEFGRKAAERFGVPFDAPQRPVSTDGPTIEQDLEMLRGMLFPAIHAMNVRETRRLILLLISAEKRLWREYTTCGLYLGREAVIALCESMTNAIATEHKPKYSSDDWAEKVKALIAHRDLFPEGETS